MLTVNMHEAKSRLSELVRRAEQGDTVVLARDGRPAVVLQPVVGNPRRVLGVWHDALAAQPRGWDRKLTVDEAFPGLFG